MPRAVQPELLDGLPPADPRAVGARADLRRLNYLMGHAGILARVFPRHFLPGSRPLRLIELGGGDGTLLLQVARRFSNSGLTAQVTLLDRQKLISTETRAAFAALNWSIESMTADVFTGLEQSSRPVDIVLANLFLHHFTADQLKSLFELAAARTQLFIACEPRRSSFALLASRFVWLVGCNGITRHDAVVSVRGGFAGHELTALWPVHAEWKATERPAGLFSHCFVAKRNV